MKSNGRIIRTYSPEWYDIKWIRQKRKEKK